LLFNEKRHFISRYLTTMASMVTDGTKRAYNINDI